MDSELLIFFGQPGGNLPGPINSIFDSGINIRLNTVQSTSELRRALDASSPLCVIASAEATADPETAEALRQAEEQGASVALLAGDASEPCVRVTGRREFVARLTACLRNERERADALLYLELDRYELYERTHGLDRADELFAAFASTLSACLQPTDLSCRFADYAYVVLLRRDGEASTEKTCEAILAACAALGEDAQNGGLPISCSIGLIDLSADNHNAEEMIFQAREACREAAAEGNRVVRFRPRLSMVTLDPATEEDWGRRLRFALEQGNFYSVQQSVTDLDNDWESVDECLSYLREDGGDQPYDMFVPFADGCALGAELDRALLPGLVTAMTQCGQNGRHIINIGTESLLDEGFPPWLGQLLAEHAVAPTGIIVQIAASSAEEHVPEFARLAAELVPLGCGLSLREFELEPAHLQAASIGGVRLVKLHPKLVSGLRGDASLAGSIAELAGNLRESGVRLMADGIQDAPHLASLWQCGVKLVAGEFLRETSQAVSR